MSSRPDDDTTPEEEAAIKENHKQRTLNELHEILNYFQIMQLSSAYFTIQEAISLIKDIKYA